MLTNLRPTDIALCHLHLGSASHIWLPITKFKARALGELHRKVSKMDWNEWISLSADNDNSSHNISVAATCEKSRLIHSKAVSERVLRGICLCLQIPTDETPEKTKTVDKPQGDNADGVKVIVKVYHDEVTLLLDTAATPLHKRGYRLETAKAPLREDIAFAMLYAAGWKPLPLAMHKESDEKGVVAANPYDAFLDPFCGSGTIAIEAASIKMGLAPGRLRPPPLQGTPFFTATQWNAILASALKRTTENKELTIFASDRDKGAICITQANAARAGVSLVLTAERAAFSNTPWFRDLSKIPGNNLLIASNLPFGQRVGWSKQPRHFYQKLLHYVERVFHNRHPATHASAMLLMSDPTGLHRSGSRLKFTRKLQTLHGGMTVAFCLASNNR